MILASSPDREDAATVYVERNACTRPTTAVVLGVLVGLFTYDGFAALSPFLRLPIAVGAGLAVFAWYLRMVSKAWVYRERIVLKIGRKTMEFRRGDPSVCIEPIPFQGSYGSESWRLVSSNGKFNVWPVFRHQSSLERAIREMFPEAWRDYERTL